MKIHNGFGIIEIIVSMGIFLIFVTTGAVTVTGGLSSLRQSNEYTQALLYAKEGIEAARSLRNQGWSTPFLATDCSSGCGVDVQAGAWSWSGSSSTRGPFTRTVTIVPGQRDGGGALVESGGTNDNDVYKVTSQVEWSFTPLRPLTVELTTYLTNFTKSILSDWNAPAVLSSFDFSTQNSGNNSADVNAFSFANSTLFVGRTSSGGNEFLAVDMSNLSVPSLCSGCVRELGDTVNDIFIAGNYAYIASNSNSQELQVIDISVPSNLSSAGFASFNATSGNSGNDNANAVAVVVEASKLYMARAGGNEFLRFSVSSPLSPTLEATGNQFAGTPTDMVVVGSYAFITSNDNAAELQVMNINTMQRDAVFNLDSGNNNADALSIAFDGVSTLLLGRASSSAPELYAIDISNPTTPTILSTIEIGSSVNEIAVAPNRAFLLVGSANQDFLVIDTSNLASLPALPAYAVLNVTNTPRAIWYEATLDAVFLGGNSDTTEIEVLTSP